MQEMRPRVRTARFDVRLDPAERALLDRLAAERQMTRTAVLLDLLRQAERGVLRDPPVDTTGRVAGDAVKATA